MKDTQNNQDGKRQLANLSASLVEATQAAAASTVTVHARRRLPSTGVVVEPGLVLTASHTVREEEDIQVTLADGTTLAAELLGRDPHSDLAVLELAEAVGTPAQANENPQVGQVALALGRPAGDVQASFGIVSASGGPLRSRAGGQLESYLRTDAVAYPGFSGGPLVDAEGRVLGINTSGLGWGSLMAIPAKQAWKIAKHIQEHGGVKRGYLGVRSQWVEMPAGALQREQASGLLIASVEEDSPAAAAGLIVGDIIVGFAGQPVADHDALLLGLNSGVVDSATSLEYLRGGKLQTVQITATELPEQPRRGRGGWGRKRRGFGRGRHGMRHFGFRFGPGLRRGRRWGRR